MSFSVAINCSERLGDLELLRGIFGDSIIMFQGAILIINGGTRCIMMDVFGQA